VQLFTSLEKNLRQELLKHLGLQSQASMWHRLQENRKKTKSNAIKRHKCCQTCSTTKNLLKRRKKVLTKNIDRMV